MSRILVFGKIGESDDINDIVSARFDPQAGSLTRLSSMEIGRSPDYIVAHPHLPRLVYVATRSNAQGKVTLVRISEAGEFEIVGSASSGLNDPCHMAFFVDGLVIAHFLGSGVTFLPLNRDGTFAAHHPPHIFRPTYIKQSHPRQDAPHCHQIIVHGEEILVPDQGCNRVWRLRYDDGFTLVGSLDDFEEGEGCRHGVVKGELQVVWLNQVNCFTFFLDTGKCLQRIPIYPPCDADNLQRPMLSSALILRGEQLICTNRRSPRPERDAICVFHIAPDGLVGTPMFLWPGLSHMRELDPSDDGEYLCVGGKDAGGVVVFDRYWRDMARMPLQKVAVAAWARF